MLSPPPAKQQEAAWQKGEITYEEGKINRRSHFDSLSLSFTDADHHHHHSGLVFFFHCLYLIFVCLFTTTTAATALVFGFAI